MPETTKRIPRLRLRVTAAAESRLRAGHPWLFSDSIREQNRPGVQGELAVVYDRQDRFFAIGLFDPDSPIRVRILHRGSPEPMDAAWWKKRLEQARDLRRGWFGPETTGYRCIHGENDGFPGLVLDRYGETSVVKIYTASWLSQLADLLPLMVEVFQIPRLVLRTSRNALNAAAKTSWKDGQVVVGTQLTESVLFRENGIVFEADVLKGQKTGFFLDQRENRQWVESVSGGRRVLNAFSFSGGFSLYAARGGATHVTDLDISAHALESAARNVEHNQGIPAIREAHFERVQADALDWLAESPRHRFDLAVLDPPSFAKRESERSGAIQAYRRLARLGWDQVRPDGIVVCASCSAHVSMDEFVSAVFQGIRDPAYEAQELHRAEHPPDHPARFPEASYLKCLALRKKPTRTSPRRASR